MEHLGRVTAQAALRLRQLQKVLQDMRNDEDGLYNRFKRFQTEQTSNFLKTGRNALNRMKKRHPPKPPIRDYQGEAENAERFSDSSFDSDTYEDPQGDHEDQYEPPPRSDVFFTAAPSSLTRGEYMDSCRVRAEKHHPERRTHQECQQPEDDNYIDPSEEISVDYEVPDKKENSTERKWKNTGMAPPKASPRTPVLTTAITHDVTSEDEYEVCDTDDDNERPEEAMEDWRPSYTAPGPQDPQKVDPALIPKPNNLSQEQKDSQLTRMPRPRQFPTLPRDPSPSKISADQEAEKDAEVLNKPWYTSNCDRRTAEDTLIRLAKEGSFLLRKSSGVDTKQPFTLVVFYNSRVYNIPVRFIPSTRQFALGKEKPREERFCSVSEIIESHQKKPLVLLDLQNNTKDFTTLRHPVRL